MTKLATLRNRYSKISNSKIDKVDFDNLVFGQNFTDHMFFCDYVDGKWQQPKICLMGHELLILLHESFIMDKPFLKA